MSVIPSGSAVFAAFAASTVGAAWVTAAVGATLLGSTFGALVAGMEVIDASLLICVYLFWLNVKTTGKFQIINLTHMIE